MPPERILLSRHYHAERGEIESEPCQIYVAVFGVENEPAYQRVGELDWEAVWAWRGEALRVGATEISQEASSRGPNEGAP